MVCHKEQQIVLGIDCAMPCVLEEAVSIHFVLNGDGLRPTQCVAVCSVLQCVAVSYSDMEKGKRCLLTSLRDSLSKRKWHNIVA